MSHSSESHSWKLNVTVQIDTIVLRSQNYGAVIHECHIEALSVLHFRFQRVHQLAVLGKDSQIEVVVVVGDENFSRRVDPHADGIIGDPLASDLTKVLPLVIKHFDAVSAIVGNEDFLAIVNDDAVGEPYISDLL